MIKKIKILHIVYSFGIGGLEHGVAKLANGLPDDRFVVDILALRNIPGKQFTVHEKSQLILFSASSHPTFPKKVISLAHILKAGMYDIVHTHNWPTFIIGTIAARLAGIPIIIHGEHNAKPQTDMPILLQMILARLPTHFTAICLPVSEWIHKQWKIKKKKITFIPNGIDQTRFFPATKREKIGVFIFGTVARLEPVKNIPKIIRAFKLFLERYPNAKAQLYIVGNGSQEKQLKDMVNDMNLKGQVIFTGEVINPEKYYRAMHVYINATNFWEGMSNGILEAMACGLPVIASDIYTNKVWLQVPENALLFTEGDYENLTQNMAYLYENNDIRKKMGFTNTERVKKEFTMDLFLRRNQKLYQELNNALKK